jgi:adenosylcobinamide-GDP ribazoletransferase
VFQKKINMLKQWHYFLLALGFFTRIPVPSLANFQESDLNQSVKYFPLIGIIVGFIGAMSFYVAHSFCPKSIAVLVSMATTVYLTGAFHEDGLADSADGLGGGYDRERILTIMQDSRLGTYGAIALFLMLMAKFQTLNTLHIAIIPTMLIVGHALSRLSAVWIMATLSYAKPDGKAKPLATEVGKFDLIVANFFGLLPFLVFLVVSEHSLLSAVKLVFVTLTLQLITFVWWRIKIRKWLGGYTGDTLGAMQQMSELAFYLGVLIWSYNV